jgi:hypothetical protein
VQGCKQTLLIRLNKSRDLDCQTTFSWSKMDLPDHRGHDSNSSGGTFSLASAHPNLPILPVASGSLVHTDPNIKSTRRRTKKAKTTSMPSSSTSAICHLDRMPFELLAMILGSTSSPKDVLALARCSKYYFYTLAGSTKSGSEGSHIWTAVRRTAEVPDPVPKNGWTEIGYAAFLFDGGICEVRSVLFHQKK